MQINLKTSGVNRGIVPLCIETFMEQWTFTNRKYKSIKLNSKTDSFYRLIDLNSNILTSLERIRNMIKKYYQSRF